MQTNRITRLTVLVTTALLAACAGGQTRSDAKGEPANLVEARLSLPEHALDALPLEHLLAAEFALREDNLDAAAKSYLTAAQESDDVAVARRATRVNLSAQRWQDAATALGRWRELGGGQSNDFIQADALLAMGTGDADRATTRLLDILRQGGMPATRLAGGAIEAAPDRGLAISVIERLIASPELPDDKAVLVGLSQLALKLERNDLAESLAERASERLPDAPEVWFWRARLANAAGKTDEAREILRKSVEANPDDPEILRTYAVLLKTEFGDPAAAAEALARLPPDDESLALRAAYLIEAGNWSEVAVVQRALEALPAPRPAERLILMGGVAESLAEQADAATPPATGEATRRREEATRWYEEVSASADEDYLRAQQRLAVLDQHAGRMDAAMARLVELRERADPASDAFVESYLLEAELLDRAGRSSDSLGVLDAGILAVPGDERLMYARGLLRERVGRVDEALVDFAALVEANPDNPVYINAYGYTMADRTERYDEALVLIERALSLNPEDIATIDSLGWVLFKLGKLDEAIVHLRRAYGEQPDGEIAAHLGEALWVAGKREEARAILRKAFDADPDNRVVKDTVARLKPW
jgi:tetratricopeptide (TPR) repeat protein